MSEINSYGDEVIYGVVIHNWWLVQLKNVLPVVDKWSNGIPIKEGQIGLTPLVNGCLNDPIFLFDCLPVLKEEVIQHYQNRLGSCYLSKDNVERLIKRMSEVLEKAGLICYIHSAKLEGYLEKDNQRWKWDGKEYKSIR